MKLNLVNVAFVACLGLASFSALAADTKKVQSDTRAGAAGGAAAATAIAGPAMAVPGAVAGAAVVGVGSRILRSGEMQRAKKNAEKTLKKIF